MNTIKWFGFPFRFILGTWFMIFFMVIVAVTAISLSVVRPSALKEIPRDVREVRDYVANWVWQ